MTAKQVITGRAISDRIKAVKDFYTDQDANLVIENWTGSPPPCRQFILDTVDKFESTGSVYDLPRSGRTKTATNDENVEKVKKILKKSPTSPIREVSAKAALSLSSTERIKLRLGLKSYRMQRRHALLPTDLPTRKAACEALLLQQQNNKQFKRRLIFTDECSFQLGGTVNTYNCYYHSLENPHYTADVPHKQGSLMVFCGVCAECVFGPYFIHDNVDQNVYQSIIDD
ncbi:MAG: putative transposable element tc3 transposase, partial [Streblomastix strix]